MKKSIEETRAEFKEFMDAYVEKMRADFAADRRRFLRKELPILVGLVLLALIYQFIIMPRLEAWLIHS